MDSQPEVGRRLVAALVLVLAHQVERHVVHEVVLRHARQEAAQGAEQAVVLLTAGRVDVLPRGVPPQVEAVGTAPELLGLVTLEV